MSDVRDELIGVLYRVGVQQNMTAADAILERFEVTRKPVVEVGVLEQWILTAAALQESGRAVVVCNFLGRLDEAGLEIVRKEAGE